MAKKTKHKFPATKSDMYMRKKKKGEDNYVRNCKQIPNKRKN